MALNRSAGWGCEGSTGDRCVNRYGRIVRTALATLAIAAAAGLFLSGCSDISSPAAHDLGYPAVHDMPAPRADATLTPDQVKQATDDLESQRDRLNTEATGKVTPVSIAPGNAAPGSQPQKAAAQPAAGQPATQAGASEDAMTAGAYAKP